MLKPGNEAFAPALSVTSINMLFAVPTSLFPGVPVSVPVIGSKEAHEGLFVILKVNVSPVSSSEAVGVKL